MPVGTEVRICRALILVLTIISLHSGPSQAQARKAPPPQPNATTVLEIIEKDARPKASGDEYLYFRLYLNGNVEFEANLTNKTSEQGVYLQRIHLKEDDQNELFGLAGSCLSLPNDFDPMQRLEEKIAIARVRIRAGDGDYRQIVIHYYSPENEKTQLYYPEGARKLMQKVSELRRRYLQEV